MGIMNENSSFASSREGIVEIVVEEVAVTRGKVEYKANKSHDSSENRKIEIAGNKGFERTSRSSLAPD